VQAAVVSALSSAVGAALPLTLIVLAPIGVRVPVTALAARLLGAGRAALRVTIGGGLAMGLTGLSASW
jgi:hypothetical protein